MSRFRDVRAASQKAASDLLSQGFDVRPLNARFQGAALGAMMFAFVKNGPGNRQMYLMLNKDVLINAPGPDLSRAEKFSGRCRVCPSKSAVRTAGIVLCAKHEKATSEMAGIAMPAVSVNPVERPSSASDYPQTSSSPVYEKRPTVRIEKSGR